MTHLTFIAALGLDRAIGRAGELPWSLPDDMQRFKALTVGKPVLMGRKTAESLGRALPRRRNVVISRNPEAPFAGMEMASSPENALALLQGEGEIMVIGGGEIYQALLPFASKLQLTEVEDTVAGADAFFPEWDPAQWEEVLREFHPIDARHAQAFSFVDYVRRS